MLKTRVLTILFLAVLIGLCLWINPMLLSALFLIMMFVAIWEWTRFYQPDGFAWFCFWVFILFALLNVCVFYDFCGFLVRRWSGLKPSCVLSSAIMLFWGGITFFTLLYPKGKRFWHSSLVGGFVGVLLLMFFQQAVYRMLVKELVYVLIIVWSVDSVAYLVGKRFGKRKMAPLISPGKTWEGVWGGSAAGLCVVVLGYYWLKPNLALPYWVVMGGLTITASIMGDLFESLIKRVAGVKDSGTCLPGHGGILDRIDSLLAAIPIFYSCTNLFSGL